MPPSYSTPTLTPWHNNKPLLGVCCFGGDGRSWTGVQHDYTRTIYERTFKKKEIASLKFSFRRAGSGTLPGNDFHYYTGCPLWNYQGPMPALKRMRTRELLFYWQLFVFLNIFTRYPSSARNPWECALSKPVIPLIFKFIFWFPFLFPSSSAFHACPIFSFPYQDPAPTS